jgi:TRAP-type C4-dicarboxylate transport system substrate-binding protein
VILITGVIPFKLHEVAPYITRVDLGAVFSGALAMNKNTWDSLPPHMKDLFRGLGRDYAKMCADLVAQREKSTWETLAKNPNVKVSELPQAEREKWAKALPDIAGDWVKRNGEPGRVVLKSYMEEARKRGAKPLRDWDKGL